jgi:hypothetical protein
MTRTGSRAVLVGLSAAAGSFAAAAMLSAVSAPTARADDPYTDILNDVTTELGYGQTALSQASTDFAGGDVTDGLAQLSIGTDDDLVGVPDILQVGTTDALTGVTVIPASDFNFAHLDDSPTFTTPTTLAVATTEANSFYTEGVTLSNDIASLSPTDYADTALDNALSTADQWIIPDQIVAIGDFIAYF